MYALISGYWYALINGIIMRTRAINESTASTASLFDEDAVYVPDRECFWRSPYLQEGTIPYCLRGPSTVYTQRQKR